MVMRQGSADAKTTGQTASLKGIASKPPTGFFLCRAERTLIEFKRFFVFRIASRTYGKNIMKKSRPRFLKTWCIILRSVCVYRKTIVPFFIKYV